MVIKRNLGWGIWEFFVLVLKIREASKIISKLNTENGKGSGREKQREKDGRRRGKKRREMRRKAYKKILYQNPLSLSCSITSVL